VTPSLFDDENFVIMWVIVVVLVRFGNLLFEGEKRDKNSTSYQKIAWWRHRAKIASFTAW